MKEDINLTVLFLGILATIITSIGNSLLGKVVSIILFLLQLGSVVKQDYWIATILFTILIFIYVYIVFTEERENYGL